MSAKLLVIFDMDGTLVDSEPIASHAMLHVLPQLGEPVDALLRRYRGWRFARVMADIESRLGLRLPEGFEMMVRERMSELFPHMLKPMPGAAQALRALSEHRIPFCVASNGPLFKMREALALSGLAAWLEPNLFSAYEVGAWKPDPTLFLSAARAMGFQPDECVVVEDSEVGVRAALAANMRCLHFVPADLPLGINDSLLDAAQYPVTARFARMDELAGLLADSAASGGGSTSGNATGGNATGGAAAGGA